MNRFGELISLRRNRKKRSQQKLIDAVNAKAPGADYNQVAVSRWERGEALPESEAVVVAIADDLGIDHDELLLAWRAGREPDAKRPGNTPGEYFDELRQELEFYESAGRACECWFIGPDVLPGLETDLPSLKWVENMRRGHEYHFFWVLDYLSRRTLEGMKILLSSMREKGAVWTPERGKTGSLHLYAFAFDPDHANAERQYREFKKLSEIHPSIPWLRVYEPRMVLDKDLKVELQGVTQKWSTIISYFPRDLDFNRDPIASVSTNCLKRRLSDPAELNFFWFTKKEAWDLRDTVLAIKRHIPKEFKGYKA